MLIKRVVVGELETNCYLLIKDNNCLVIDPGDEYKKIVNEINDLSCKGILLTHHHFDHVGAVDDLVNKYNVLVYDKNNLKEGINNIFNFSFEVIYNPGHTDDSISFYFKEDNLLFSGDFIFKGSIGRTDLGGNYSDMINSINKIKNYDNNIIIKPGHGEETKLGDEIKYNPFFN